MELPEVCSCFTSAARFVFQTRKTAGWLAAELSKEGHQVALLSGEMMVEQRAAVIERFREGKEKVLVTTNVCARGKAWQSGEGRGSSSSQDEVLLASSAQEEFLSGLGKSGSSQ